MRIYVKKHNPTGLNPTKAGKVFALEMLVSRAFSNRSDLGDSARRAMHVEMGMLERMNRQRYLKETYERVLQDVVGGEDAVIAEIKKQALRLGFLVTTEAGRLNICFNDSALTDVLDVYYGDRAFQQLAPGGKRKRMVYVHRGTGEHYVKDDRGVLTARFAYRSMNEYQYAELKLKRLITGRKGLFDPVSEKVRNMHKLPPGTPSLQQAIYIHQRYGSGEEQRGVCLSSTPHNIVSDQGFVFGGLEPIRIAIDLARIAEGERFLYNLFQDPDFWIGLDYYRWQKKGASAVPTYTAQETREGLLGSTTKNTELYLFALLWTDVVMVHRWHADTRTWDEVLYTHLGGAEPQPLEPQEPPPHVRGARGDEE